MASTIITMNSLSQLKLYLSRLGKGSKLLICGDPEQSDLEPSSKHDYYTDLEFVADRLHDHPQVGVIDFSPAENLRDPLIRDILQCLS